MVNKVSDAVTADDEIDLIDLFKALWRGKLFIISIGILSVLLGTLYFYIYCKPEYEASFTVGPVISSDLAALNLDRPTQLKPLVSADAYTIFRGVLFASSTMHLFKKQETKLIPNFRKNNTVKIDLEVLPSGHSNITAKSDDKKIAAAAADAFLQYVQKISVVELDKSLQREKLALKAHINEQLEIEYAKAEAARKLEIKNIGNSLSIAANNKLEAPSSIIKSTTDVSKNDSLKSYQNLSQEMEHLKKRPLDFFNSELAVLKATKSYLDKKHSSTQYVVLGKKEGATYVSDTAIQKNMKLIILLSAFFGMAASSFLVAIRFISLNTNQVKHL